MQAALAECRATAEFPTSFCTCSCSPQREVLASLCASVPTLEDPASKMFLSGKCGLSASATGAERLRLASAEFGGLSDGRGELRGDQNHLEKPFKLKARILIRISFLLFPRKVDVAQSFPGRGSRLGICGFQFPGCVLLDPDLVSGVLFDTGFFIVVPENQQDNCMQLSLTTPSAQEGHHSRSSARTKPMLQIPKRHVSGFRLMLFRDHETRAVAPTARVPTPLLLLLLRLLLLLLPYSY